MLRKLRCDVIQGYYYRKPLCAENFGKVLLEHKHKRSRLTAVTAIN